MKFANTFPTNKKPCHCLAVSLFREGALKHQAYLVLTCCALFLFQLPGNNIPALLPGPNP